MDSLVDFQNKKIPHKRYLSSFKNISLVILNGSVNYIDYETMDMWVYYNKFECWNVFFYNHHGALGVHEISIAFSKEKLGA
jgi:hypothetical protein